MADLGLSQTAQYALRAMTCIAAHSSGNEHVSADAIAHHTSVPPAFLSKVLRRLTAAGLLRSTKGHHGGFVLAREAATIRLLDILEAVDVSLTGDTCAFGWGQCSTTRPCPLHHTHLELKHALLAWATRRTLADVDVAGCRVSPAPP